MQNYTSGAVFRSAINSRCLQGKHVPMRPIAQMIQTITPRKPPPSSCMSCSTECVAAPATPLSAAPLSSRRCRLFAGASATRFVKGRKLLSCLSLHDMHVEARKYPMYVPRLLADSVHRLRYQARLNTCFFHCNVAPMTRSDRLPYVRTDHHEKDSCKTFGISNYPPSFNTIPRVPTANQGGRADLHRLS